MAQWEFLIQKEGDRLWLPLESPSVEVLEGRYRMMVRSDRNDELVEIRICHESTLEDPPRRRVQKRSRRLNKEGLMVLLPFTYFRPGNWEMRCRGDLMSDLLGDVWQEAVTLHVLPKEADLLDDEQLLGSPQTGDLVNTSAELTDLEDAIRQAAIAARAKAAEEFAQSTVAESDPEVVETALQLSLDREAYVAHSGTPFALSGQLQVPDNCSETTANSLIETLVLETLQIDLLDPQTSETVAAFQFPCPSSQLPQPFSHAIAVPEQCESRLLLGEVALMGTLAADRPTEVLATQSFSITANLEDLLSAIADDFAEDETFNALSEVPDNSDASDEAVNLDFLDLVEDAPKTPAMVEWQLSERTPLPPQIYQPEPVGTPEERRRALQLPKFPSLAQAQLASPGLSPETDVPKKTDNLMGDREDAIAPDSATSELAADPEFANPNETTADLDADINTVLANADLGIAADLQAATASATNAETELVEAEITDTELADEDSSPEESSSETAPEANTELVATGEALVPLAPEAPETAPQPQSMRDIVLDSLDDWDVAQVSADDDPESVPALTPNEPVSSTDKAFHDLRLHDRFWNRLSAIATDGELSTWLQTHFPPADDGMFQVDREEGSVPSDALGEVTWQPTDPTALEIAPQEVNTLLPAEALPEDSAAAELAQIYTAAGSDASLAAQEIVVNEAPIDLERRRYADEAAAQSRNDLPPLDGEEAAPRRLSLAEAFTSLAEEDPVPVPELLVPAGELTSGKTLLVRARLPETLARRCYVKLWLADCQTRSVIEGPLWLLDFSPDGMGHLESMIRLTVPFGCLDIRFEAIAVEMQTQRESHKVSIMRATVPPDLPAASLDLTW